jgi:hypothetical protein
MLILDQKNLKTEHQIDCQNKENKELSHQISSLNKKLQSLNLKLCEKKEYKETLDKENLHTQTYYINVLKVRLLLKVIQYPPLTASTQQRPR